MIYKILERYKSLIRSYEVRKFHQIKNTYELVIDFTLINDYKFFAKDYLFMDGSRKYSFHFQDCKNNMIFRFDNADYWIDISTFPHHKHLPNKVEESGVMNLEKVFSEIAKYLE